MKRRIVGPTLLCLLLISVGAIAAAHTTETPDKEPNERPLGCKMRFDLKGSPALFETAMGTGILTCNDGQRLKLRITAAGGGITFGRSEIVGGTGSFSDVRTIDELFGSYVQSVVYVSAGGSAAVQVFTKGRITLVLEGTGRGVDFGFAFEKFTIEPGDLGRALTHVGTPIVNPHQE